MEKVVTTVEKLLIQKYYLDLPKPHDEDEDTSGYIEYNDDDDDDWGNDF